MVTYSVNETNLLEKVIAVTDKSPHYTFRYKDKVLTLYRGKQLLEQMKFNLNKKDKDMTITQARDKAFKLSQKGKRIYVNVDADGNCSASTSFNTDATIYCYLNGGQVALNDKQTKKIALQIKSELETKNNLNQTIMATVKSNTASKVSSTSNKAAAPSKDKGSKKEVAKPSANPNAVGKATTLFLTPGQWKKLESIEGGIRFLVAEAVIKTYKL